MADSIELVPFGSASVRLFIGTPTAEPFCHFDVKFSINMHKFPELLEISFFPMPHLGVEGASGCTVHVRIDSHSHSVYSTQCGSAPGHYRWGESHNPGHSCSR